MFEVILVLYLRMLPLKTTFFCSTRMQSTCVTSVTGGPCEGRGTVSEKHLEFESAWCI